jgi:hypothetical protein
MKDTTHRHISRKIARQIGSAILAAVVVISTALIGLAFAPEDLLRGSLGHAFIGVDSNQPAAELLGQRGDRDQRTPREPPMDLGEADGIVPDGVTVFDDAFPAVANLDPRLLDALRRAATDARADGVEFHVTSGWRSPEYQEQLLNEAVLEYGSEEEAGKWVATAETSAHVSGDAVDIGPSDAMAWLSDHGAGYGLCQIYGNEPWHFELRPEAISDGCPPMYDDPTQDPRMQQ